MNKGKQVWQRTPPPTLLAARYVYTSATQVSVRLASAQGFLQLLDYLKGVALQTPTLPYAITSFPVSLFLSSPGDNKFPSLIVSLFFWRCLAASTSYFLHVAKNLRPPSMPLIRMSVPAHKSLLVFATASQCSHTRLSQGHGCTQVIPCSGPLRYAPMIRSKTRWCKVRSLA